MSDPIVPGTYLVGEDGSLALIKRPCGSPWGVGVYVYDGEEIYGYGCVDNPHDFTPDEECCTAEEISAWKQACADWDASR